MEQFNKAKVLLVDDLPSLRKVVRKQLAELGITEVYEAGDGVEASELIKAHPVDLVISDWEMPRMNGIELLQLLRSKPEYENLGFIMITANSRKEAVIDAANSKVSGYISKPFNAKILEAKIIEILAHKE